MLCVDEGGLATKLLYFGYDMQSDGSLTGRLGPVDLDDTSSGDAADAEGDIQRNGACGDPGNAHAGIVPKAHDGALAALLFDLGDGSFQRCRFAVFQILRSHINILSKRICLRTDVLR